MKVLGTISDAQESELLAVQELWPEVPHQVCQFHVLRDASKAAFEADKQVKTAMRKRLHGIGEGGAQTDQEAAGHGLAH